MNIMKDLETWGTTPGSAIRSIGAVAFDPFGDGHMAEFYRNIDDQSCLDAGLTIDPDTYKWWMQQGDTAQRVLLKNPMPLKQVGEEFHAWFQRNKGMWVWAHGPSFDVVIWEAAMRAVGLKCPWKFWDVRCTRTIYEAGRLNHHTVKRRGVHHFALDDAKHQALCVQLAYRNIKPVEKV
jgi:hypothetical protein